MYYFLKTKRKINAAKLQTNPRKTWDLMNRTNLGGSVDIQNQSFLGKPESIDLHENEEYLQE